MKTEYNEDFASRYARSRALGSLAQEVWVTELTRVTEGRHISTVVDLGAGAGRFWPVFQEVWQPTAIVALDLSTAMLGRGEEQPAVYRVVGDIDNLPIAGGCADVCFCSMILHYSRQPINVLSQLKEIIRPGGVVCIRTGTPATLESFDFLDYFLTAKKAELSVMPSKRDVEHWLRSAGFEQLDMIIVKMQPNYSRWARLRKVWARGFPSLQLVPRAEFLRGFARYAIRLASDGIRHHPLTCETTFFATGRRL
jgi:SAM-dependent methyltransferase